MTERLGYDSQKPHKTRDGQFLWTYASVKNVLVEEAYTGVLVNHRREYLGGKARAVNKADWLRREYFYPVIIEKADWKQVHALLKQQARPAGNNRGDATATLETIGNDPQNPQKNRQLTFRLTGSDIQPDSNITLAIGQKSASYDAIVPTSAIRTDNNGSFVLAIVSKSTPLSTRYTATRVDVQVLASDDKSSAVSGIGSGEFVITTSTKPIEAGTQVRLAENG